MIKQLIIGRLRETQRVNMEEVIGFMNSNHFFDKACHSHHRYGGGLAHHAWQTYLIALDLVNERRKRTPDAPPIDLDSIAICALLHDLCGCTGFKDLRGHGRRSAKILKELGLSLSLDEFLAIRFHMSLRKNTNHILYNEASVCELRAIIHKADCKSACMRKGYLPYDVQSKV